MPSGFLPVYSVDTEEEAKNLLILTCERSRTTGNFIARELVHAQTLENLDLFSDRLAENHRFLVERARSNDANPRGD